MFKDRARAEELMDDLSLSGEALRRNLEELELINHWLGGYRVVTSALEKLRPSFPPATRPLTVADLGCGGGDTLRAIARWARRKAVPVELAGLDANAFMVDYASRQCRAFDNIAIWQENIFSSRFQSRAFDIIICSLFCHHFSDQELTGLLRQLQAQARTAVIINDLHRHPLPYYFIKWLTRLLPCSYLVRNDAPLSVLRAFKRRDLESLLRQTCPGHYTLRWCWPFRWQIIIPGKSANIPEIE